MASPKAVSDANFEADVLKSSGPVLVDFWAEWCGPCKAIAPALEDLARDMDGKVTVAKVNIDENPVSPSKYGVRSIPTLILFDKGAEVARVSGAMQAGQLVAWVRQHVARGAV